MGPTLAQLYHWLLLFCCTEAWPGCSEEPAVQTTARALWHQLRSSEVITTCQRYYAMQQTYWSQLSVLSMCAEATDSRP